MRLIFIILILFPAVSYAEESIGKLVQREGFISKTNINCTGSDCKNTGSKIYPGERIITSKGSRAKILLNDGTAILIYGRSDVIISRVRLTERHRPSEILLEKGTLKIIQKNSFLDVSLTVKTPVSVIKTVNSVINVVTGLDETALFVYSGEAGFAGLIPSRDKAFVLEEGYESSVKRGESPSRPVKVSRILRSSWLGRHLLSGDSRRVLKYNKKSGTADWPFIKDD